MGEKKGLISIEDALEKFDERERLSGSLLLEIDGVKYLPLDSFRIFLENRPVVDEQKLVPGYWLERAGGGVFCSICGKDLRDSVPIKPTEEFFKEHSDTPRKQLLIYFLLFYQFERPYPVRCPFCGAKMTFAEDQSDT